MATPDYKSTRLLLRKTTSQQDYETTSGAVAGGASQELWIGRVGSKLKTQSLSILTAQKKQQRIWNIQK